MKKLNSIYVVEDDSAARTMMLDFLSQYKDVTVKGFVTGEACIGEIVYTKAHPDLILMDYYLEGSLAAKFQGIETLTKIKEISPETRIIMFTSTTDQDIMKRALEKGASDYVIKGTGGFDEVKRIIDSSFKLN
jgi:two-component system OmpR family response regulator